MSTRQEKMNLNDNQNNLNNGVENNQNNINNVELPQNNLSQVNVVQNNGEKDIADKTIEKVENFINTNDYSKDYDQSDVKKNKTNAVLCYIPLVTLYFLFTGKYKKSNYLFFHANQGLLVTICWAIVFVISGILKAIFTVESLVATLSTPGWVKVISYLLYCACIFLSGFGVVNTLNGFTKELPLIGKYKILK